MRTPIHPHRVSRAIDGACHMQRDDRSGNRIDLGLDAQILRPHDDVLRGVEDALPLGHVLHRHLIEIGVRARFVVDRKAAVVADVRPRRALDPILVQSIRPRPGQIDDLSSRRRRGRLHLSLRERRRATRERGHTRHRRTVVAIAISIPRTLTPPSQLASQLDGSHFDPFGSFLKLSDVIHVRVRYVGSSTTVVITIH